MWFVVLVNRNGRNYYIHSPSPCQYALRETEEGAFLFSEEQRARKRTEHLLQPGDEVRIIKLRR